MRTGAGAVRKEKVPASRQERPALLFHTGCGAEGNEAIRLPRQPQRARVPLAAEPLESRCMRVTLTGTGSDSLTLTAGTDYTIGTPAAAVATITNNDASATPPSSNPSTLPRPTTISAFDLDGNSFSPVFEEVANAFDNDPTTHSGHT
jgi:hypothetical protein